MVAKKRFDGDGLAAARVASRTLTRLEAIAQLLCASRSAATRMAIDRGLVILEKEFGLESA